MGERNKAEDARTSERLDFTNGLTALGDYCETGRTTRRRELQGFVGEKSPKFSVQRPTSLFLPVQVSLSPPLTSRRRIPRLTALSSRPIIITLRALLDQWESIAKANKTFESSFSLCSVRPALLNCIQNGCRRNLRESGQVAKTRNFGQVGRKDRTKADRRSLVTASMNRELP